MSEAYRCLQPSGVLRLSFPGLAGVLARHYRSSDYQGAHTGFVEAFQTWHHKHFYAETSLELVSKHIGFRGFCVMPFGESAYPELRRRETRPDQVDLNLVVELTK